MLSKKSAFTMAETLVAIGLIGVLAGFLIPAMKDFAPDKNKAMAKKATNIAERIIYEMVNDEDLYPRVGVDGETEYVGLDNQERVVYMGNEYEGKTKFCKIFIRKLSTKSDNVTCTQSVPATGPNQTRPPTFITEDGMFWFIPTTNDIVPYKPDGSMQFFNIFVDVNGPKPPNCNIRKCSDGDIFTLYVYAFGDVLLAGDEDSNEVKIYKSDTLFKKE